MKRTSKIIAVLAVLIAGSMIASGALLTYLSNTVTTTATVSSPMEQWISNDFYTGYVQDNSITFPSVHGGETVTFYVKTINNANAPITGNVDNIVTNWIGVTGNDFVSVNVRTWDGSAWDGPYDLIALGLYGEPTIYTVKFSYGPTPITWTAGQVDITEVAVTFKAAAFGTYTFTSQIVP
ncbi:MAG TPA: hypothetical protein VMY59_05670 [Candidatus Thermoplasmatota archaeon]|nr:hypothetical protein [Candidatus Thermoplasmatota archaeon]